MLPFSSETPGRNPLTGEVVTARRRRIRTEFNLPMKDAYDAFILNLLETGECNR